MPGLIACGRRWAIGSDDLIIPAGLLLITNCIWLIVLARYSPEYVADSRFNAGKIFWYHIVSHVSFLIACIITEIILIIISLKGTVMNDEPRKSAQYFCYVRLILFVAQLVTCGSGLYYLSDIGLRFPATKIIISILIWELLLLLLLVWFVWDRKGKAWVKWRKGTYDPVASQDLMQTAHERSWMVRCNRMCCCLPRKTRSEESIREVANIFSKLFFGNDFVPSDILVALLVLQQERHDKEREIVEDKTNGVEAFYSGVPITKESKMVDFASQDMIKVLHDMTNCETFTSETFIYEAVTDMHHFMHYAWGGYGWFYFIPLHCTLRGYTGFLRDLQCQCCQRSRSSNSPAEYHFEGDDTCLCNTSAFLNSFPRDSSAVLFYVSYLNKINETPFFIVLDHGKRTIVIIPRGTMSFDDAVTDVLMRSMTFPLKVPRPDWKAHSGMAQAANYMYTKIISEGLIDKAQAHREGDQPYDILVIGHSLGAGTAPLLAILLHQDFPDLRCFAFSPPGGCLSKAAVDATKDFITTIIIGDDMIPRMGLPQFEHLRTDICGVLRRIKKPKYPVLCRAICGKLRSRDVLSEEVVSQSEPPKEDDPLFVPGKCIHILCPSPGHYTGVWTENDQFRGLIVGPNMLMDHRGDTVLRVLSTIIRQYSPKSTMC